MPGSTILSDPESGVLQGYMTEASYYPGYMTAPGFRGIKAQSRLDHRYFNEDVGFGLVFYHHLGLQLGVPTPVSDAIIAVASVMMGRDYLAEAARTTASLGIAGLSAAELETAGGLSAPSADRQPSATASRTALHAASLPSRVSVVFRARRRDSHQPQIERRRQREPDAPLHSDRAVVPLKKTAPDRGVPGQEAGEVVGDRRERHDRHIQAAGPLRRAQDVPEGDLRLQQQRHPRRVVEPRRARNSRSTIVQKALRGWA